MESFYSKKVAKKVYYLFCGSEMKANIDFSGLYVEISGLRLLLLLLSHHQLKYLLEVFSDLHWQEALPLLCLLLCCTPLIQ